MGTLRKFFNGVFGKKETKVTPPTATDSNNTKTRKRSIRKSTEKGRLKGYLRKLANNRKHTPGRVRKIEPIRKNVYGSPEFTPKRTKIKGYMKPTGRRKSA